MENERIYEDFERRNRAAEEGGGADKVKKQHEAGKMTARERIETLLDKGTFVELDKFVVHRCTNYGMERHRIPGDGVVSGYGKIDGRQVFVYAYDFTVLGGSLSATNAQKIVTLLRKQTVPRRTPLGSVRIAERFFILGREVLVQVDLDFVFRIPRGGSRVARVFCFTFSRGIFYSYIYY